MDSDTNDTGSPPAPETRLAGIEAAMMQQHQDIQQLHNAMQHLAALLVPLQQAQAAASPPPVVASTSATTSSSTAHTHAVRVDFSAEQTWNISTPLERREVPENFLQLVEAKLQLADATEAQMLAAVPIFLSGESRAWWLTRQNATSSMPAITTWLEFRTAFLDHACDAGDERRRRRQYEKEKQQPHESFNSFANRFMEAYHRHPDAPSEAEAADRLRHRARPAIRDALKIIAASGTTMTLHEVLQFGQRFEADGDSTSEVTPMTVGTIVDSSSDDEVTPEVAAVNDTKTRRTQSALLSAAIAKLRQAGAVTLTELRKGTRFNKLTAEQRALCKDLHVCTRCRSELGTGGDACTHTAEIDQLMRALPKPPPLPITPPSGG